MKRLYIKYNIKKSPPVLTNPRNDPYSIAKYHKDWIWIRTASANESYDNLKEAVGYMIQLDATREPELIDELHTKINHNPLGKSKIISRLIYYFIHPEDKYVSSMLSMFLPGMNLNLWYKVIKQDLIYLSPIDKWQNKTTKIDVPFWEMLPDLQLAIMKYIQITPDVYKPTTLWPYCSLLQWVSAMDSFWKYVSI